MQTYANDANYNYNLNVILKHNLTLSISNNAAAFPSCVQLCGKLRKNVQRSMENSVEVLRLPDCKWLPRAYGPGT